MANFFVAYERASNLGDIAAFEAALSLLGEVGDRSRFTRAAENFT